jgi:hypothetical protein
MLAMAVMILLFVHRFEVRFNNDSYQYLSVAENLRTRGEIATSIIEFDPERARGQLPAPETTFPAGYSLAINCLGVTGLSPEKAAWLVSMFSMLGVIPLLWWGAGVAGAPPDLRRLAVMLWAFNAQAILYACSIASEGLFTVLVLGGAALFIFAECNEGQAARTSLRAGMVLIGLAYWVRYAGILMVAGVLTYAGLLALRRSSRFWSWLLSLPLCLGIVLCGMMRNFWIAGTWKGGNTLAVHKSLTSVLYLFKGVCYHLILGNAKARLLIGGIVLILGFLAIVLTLLAPGYKGIGRILFSNTSMLLAILCSVYCTGIIYLGTRTMISFGTRMFVPILPAFVLLCVAVAAKSWQKKIDLKVRRTISWLVVIGTLGYASTNLYSLGQDAQASPHLEISSVLGESAPDGVLLRDWVGINMRTDTPVLSVEGQATGYLLQRPTISMVGRTFSSRKWDEDEVRKTMLDYQVRYLIIYPGIPAPFAPEQEESEFLQQLIAGKHPSWLLPVFRTAHVAIFELLQSRSAKTLNFRFIHCHLL